MPNGGTDNCMNCSHNRANQQLVNVKTAPSQTRLAFCTVHQIPVWDYAWTYCANINESSPDVTVPINSVGLYSDGYTRIPWLGRTAPVRQGQIASCAVCLTSATQGLIIESVALGLNVAFCSNDHYTEWHLQQFETRGFEGVYQVGRNALHAAVLLEDVESIRSLATDTRLLNHPDIFGWTPLHLSAYIGFIEGVAALLASSANPKLIDAAGHTPIDLAGREGFSAVVRTLEPVTYTSAQDREAALRKAASGGNLELVEVVVNAGTDIECADYRGRTPLLLAVWGGHYTTSVFLLDNGANIDVKDDYGNSPLQMVETWHSRNPDELYRLIHDWIKKADA